MTLEPRHNAPSPSYFNALKPYNKNCLSLACSCLVTCPSTTYKTVTRTGKPVTRGTPCTVHVTATSTQYLTPTGTKVAGRPSAVTVTVTRTVTASQTLISTAVDVLTHPVTVTADPLTQTVLVTDAETLTALTTVTSINTRELTETDLLTLTVPTTIEVTRTETQTATPTPKELVSCSGLGGSPYTSPNGIRFQPNCGGYYPIEGAGLIGAGNFPTFGGCLDFCSVFPDVAGVDYDQGSGICKCHSPF